MLPCDPFMLLSYVNTRLRNACASLDDLCKEEQADKAQLIARLSTIGYEYNAALNQFI